MNQSSLLFLLRVSCPQGVCFPLCSSRDRLSPMGEKYGPELPVTGWVNWPNVEVQS